MPRKKLQSTPAGDIREPVDSRRDVSAAAVVFGGYAPGLVTAVLINLPSSLYLLRAMWALLPGALLMHRTAALRVAAADRTIEAFVVLYPVIYLLEEVG